MNAFIEPLILYAVLFFRFSAGAVQPADPETFSLTAEIVRIFIYTIPSLALIWYLLLKVKSLRKWGITLPQKKDLIPLIVSLPALILIGMTITLVSSYFEGAAPKFISPQNPSAWAVLVVSCFCSSYLEESFFRFYLLSKREEMGIGMHRAVLLSTLLFSCSHIYEGPWGFLNAALSGVLLSVVFLRYRSLHGIAAAHALYNILVYILGTA